MFAKTKQLFEECEIEARKLRRVVKTCLATHTAHVEWGKDCRVQLMRVWMGAAACVSNMNVWHSSNRIFGLFVFGQYSMYLCLLSTAQLHGLASKFKKSVNKSIWVVFSVGYYMPKSRPCNVFGYGCDRTKRRPVLICYHNTNKKSTWVAMKEMRSGQIWNPAFSISSHWKCGDVALTLGVFRSVTSRRSVCCSWTRRLTDTEVKKLTLHNVVVLPWTAEEYNH